MEPAGQAEQSPGRVRTGTRILLAGFALLTLLAARLLLLLWSRSSSPVRTECGLVATA